MILEYINQVPASAPVDSWYEESSRHPFGCEPTSTETGHFTQMVWRESREIGVGRAKAPGSGGKTIVVANYDPPGNVLGTYRANVLPPKGEDEVDEAKKR